VSERLWRWMYRLTRDHTAGLSGVPGNWLSLEMGPPNDDGSPLHYARTGDDAFVLWIGYRDRWWGSLPRKEARRLAWFVLWRWWARGEWFGLRRWLFYRALAREVARHQRAMPPLTGKAPAHEAAGREEGG
jgi:hypothetical protein